MAARVSRGSLSDLGALKSMLARGSILVSVVSSFCMKLDKNAVDGLRYSSTSLILSPSPLVAVMMTLLVRCHGVIDLTCLVLAADDDDGLI